MIKIDFNEPHYSTCDCCGEKITSLTRFVYEDGDAVGYYYAQFSPHSDTKYVKCLVVICEWEDGEEEYSRETGFPLSIWCDDKNMNISLLNKDEVPWSLIKGEILNREEALKHPYKEEVFHITDHIIWEDAEVIDYFKN